MDLHLPDSVVTILLGMVEGLTEFLPISSTAHLLIVEYFLGARTDAFNVIIQAGAVTAVVVIYWEKLRDLFFGNSTKGGKVYLMKLSLSVLVTIAGCLIAHKLGWELPKELWPIVAALMIGAIVIFVAEFYLKNHKPTEEISWTTAIVIGFAQILAAIFPGTSRSGATIISGMFCGLSRPAATEFSFLVSIPTMYAASLWQAKEAYEAGLFQPYAIAELAVGFVISMITAFLVVKWLLHFVRGNTFIPFAWYRIVLGLVLIVVLWGHNDSAMDVTRQWIQPTQATPALTVADHP